MEAVGQSLQCSVIYHLFTLTDTQASEGRTEDLQLPPKVCQYTDNSCHHTVTLFTSSYLPCPSFYVLRQPTDVSKVEEEDMIVAVRVGEMGAANSSMLNDSSRGQETKGSGEEYSVLDMGKYDQDTATMLLVNHSADSRPALVQFPLSTIPQSSYTTVNTTENIVNITGMQTVELGALLTTGTPQHLDNMRAHSMAVSLRKTAVVLFQSRRRVRILMMEEEEEEEDEMDDTGAGDDSSLLQKSTVTDSIMAESYEDENKENTSVSSGHEADSSVS